jgi:hypothetical protein
VGSQDPTLFVLTTTRADYTMLEGYALEVTLTTANAAAQAWYGYDQVSKASSKNNIALVY